MDASIKHLFTNGVVPDQPNQNNQVDGAQFDTLTAVNRLVGGNEQTAKYYEDWHRLDQSNSGRRPIAGHEGVGGVSYFGHRVNRDRVFQTNIQLDDERCFLAAAVKFTNFSNYNMVIGAREGDYNSPVKHWAELYTEASSGEVRADFGETVVQTGVTLSADQFYVISAEAHDGYYRIDVDGQTVRVGLYDGSLPKDRPFFIGDTNDLSGNLRFPMAGFFTQIGIARRGMSSTDTAAIHTAFGATAGLTV